jgi:hypothetical protein
MPLYVCFGEKIKLRKSASKNDHTNIYLTVAIGLTISGPNSGAQDSQWYFDTNSGIWVTNPPVRGSCVHYVLIFILVF